ncbi:hypothetical protein, partial [Streptococcus pseudopneumoniae]|uniref:hypothetical protein n=1 Tax=Streptococcus pseudopneumoniae TaxID=257758 RepID=UPI001BB1B7CA
FLKEVRERKGLPALELRKPLAQTQYQILKTPEKGNGRIVNPINHGFEPDKQYWTGVKKLKGNYKK